MQRYDPVALGKFVHKCRALVTKCGAVNVHLLEGLLEFVLVSCSPLRQRNIFAFSVFI